MKKAPAFIACSIALTLLFYLLAYYLLPSPPPPAGLVVVFAAVAMVIVWAAGVGLKKMRERRAGASVAGGNKPHVMLAFLLLGLFGGAALFEMGPGAVLAAGSPVCKFTSGPKAGSSMPTTLAYGSACNDGAGSSGIVSDDTWSESRGPAAPDGTPAQPPPPPPPPESARPTARPSPPPTSSASLDSTTADDALPRVTGIATLLPGLKEEAGYGLYSYALISAKPTANELPKVKAYLTALLELPTAAAVEQYVPRKRINITYIPVRRLAPNWGEMATQDQVNYVVENYDYARAEVALASLNTRMGAGPAIISLLMPLNVSQHPHPVLVVDLTAAQPSLAKSYVDYFRKQAGKSQFWQASTLSHFSVSLRNFLEVTATGLGMSKDAVSSWIKVL